MASSITTEPCGPTPPFARAHRSIVRSFRAAAIWHKVPAHAASESGHPRRCARFIDARSPATAAACASPPLANAAMRRRLQHSTQHQSAWPGIASCTSCSSSSERLSRPRVASAMVRVPERVAHLRVLPRASAAGTTTLLPVGGGNTGVRYERWRCFLANFLTSTSSLYLHQTLCKTVNRVMLISGLCTPAACAWGIHIDNSTVLDRIFHVHAGWDP
mgnify:CR=1 FL=1